MEFVRTPKGQAATHLFIRLPLVWVEGPSDIPFYEGILKGVCRLESAGGRTNCEILARDVLENDTPHVVIIDGDYDVLTRVRSEHRRVVRLARYGMENYLAENVVIDRVVGQFAREQYVQGPVREFEELREGAHLFLPHVAFDIAGQKSGLSSRGVPKHCQGIVCAGKPYVPDKDLLRRWSRRYCRGASFSDLVAARRTLKRFCARGRLLDIVPAHLIISLLHRCLCAAIVRTTGKKKSGRMDESTATAFLCSAVWEIPLASPGHVSLRRRIIGAVREVRLMQGR